MPALSPTTRLVIGGVAAISSAIRAFESDATLSWSEQVLVVADSPIERQLAAAGAALLNTNKPTKLRNVAGEGDAPFDAAVSAVSDDASDEVRAAIKELVA